MKSYVLAGLSAMVVSACALTPPVDLTPAQYMAIMDPDPLPFDPLVVADRYRMDPAYPRPGYTYASGQPKRPGRRGHGIQVEYFSPDGEVFLWYPGNDAAVYGQYRVYGNAPEGQLPDSPYRVDGLKFKYQSNSYNPVTNQGGGQWERRDREFSAKDVISYAKGDIFDLSSGTVPYRRRACDLPTPMKAKPILFKEFCITQK